MRCLGHLARALAVLLGFLLSAATAQTLQTAGQVVISKKDGTLAATSSTAWSRVDALRGAVTLPAGGDLAILVAMQARLSGSGTPVLYLRALVDGKPTTTAPRSLMVGNRDWACATLNFFARNLSPGTHRVEIQWSVTRNAVASAASRTLALRFARSDSSVARLYHADGASASRPGGGWATVPGLALQTSLPWDARLTINVSGQFLSLVAGKRILIRAVVDNQPALPANVVVALSVPLGTRSFTFVTPKIARGNHAVRIEWQTDDRSMVIYPAVTVTAVPDGVNRMTAHLLQTAPTGFAVTMSSTTLQPIPNLGGKIFVPVRSDLVVRLAGEVHVSYGSRGYVRALVDGKPAGADAFLFRHHGWFSLEAEQYTFVARNLERGWHTVGVYWALQPGTTGTLYIGDRCLAVNSVVGQRPLLVTALESTRPPGYKYGGKFASSVVELRGGRRVFRSYVPDMFFRARPGVADWFQEVSQGHLFVTEALVEGPFLKMYDEKYYREKVPNPFTKMKIEALQKADPYFDYSLYDRDGDRVVRTDELYPVVVMYQDWPWGEVRTNITNVATQDGVTLNFSGGLATVYTPDFKTPAEIGTFDHELCHLLIGAGDMYESGDPTAPGPFSIMDQNGKNPHLDAMHKIKAGRWFDVFPVTRDGYRTLRPIEQRGSNVYKLYDPRSHGGEYFLVENRQRIGYDALLPTDGLAIWHCDEKRLPNWRTAVEIEPAGGLNYQYARYLFTGRESGYGLDFWDGSTPVNSRWHDGKTSGVGVWGIKRVPGRNDIQAFLDVPGPGVLLQFRERRVWVDTTGKAALEMRVVNTGPQSDSFRVALAGTANPSWTVKTFSLPSYATTKLPVTVSPPFGFTGSLLAVAASRTNTSVSCGDTARIRYTLRLVGTPQPGAVVTLECLDPPERYRSYFMGAALSNQPGIPIPGKGTVPLAPDALFFSVPSLPQIFQQFVNRLDGQGAGRSYVAIPNDPRFRGLTLYFAYVTYDALGIRELSNGVRMGIR